MGGSGCSRRMGWRCGRRRRRVDLVRASRCLSAWGFWSLHRSIRSRTKEVGGRIEDTSPRTISRYIPLAPMRHPPRRMQVATRRLRSGPYGEPLMETGDRHNEGERVPGSRFGFFLRALSQAARGICCSRCGQPAQSTVHGDLIWGGGRDGGGMRLWCRGAPGRGKRCVRLGPVWNRCAWGRGSRRSGASGHVLRSVGMRLVLCRCRRRKTHSDAHPQKGACEQKRANAREGRRKERHESSRRTGKEGRKRRKCVLLDNRHAPGLLEMIALNAKKIGAA